MPPKDELKKIFETSTEISVAACDIMRAALGGAAAFKHGPILWALMDTEGTPATISGNKLFVYLQYYFCAVVYREDGSAVTRPLGDCDLAYLVTAAAYGLQDGCTKFDDAYAAGDLSSIHALQINEQQFLKFFYSAETPFNMATVVSHVKQLRAFWNAHPSAFVGFISPGLASYLLEQQGVGSFFIRFNSTGGISAVVFGADSKVASHPLDPAMMATPLSLIALIQRSTTLQSFAQISDSASLPKAQVLPSLKVTANVDEAAVEAEIKLQRGEVAANASSAPGDATTPAYQQTFKAAAGSNSGSAGRNIVVTTAPAFTKQSSATGASAFGAVKPAEDGAKDSNSKKRKKEAEDTSKTKKKKKKSEEEEDEEDDEEDGENDDDENGSDDENGDGGSNEDGGDGDDDDDEEDSEDEDYEDEEDDEDEDISDEE